MTPHENPSYQDFALGTMYQIDPERLAQIRRIVSGMTRCPECDALNRADQHYCDTCGAKLYPEVKDKEEDEPYVPPQQGMAPPEGGKSEEGVPSPKSEEIAGSETARTDTKRCLECFSVNKADQSYCGYCGKPLYPSPEEDTDIPSRKKEKKKHEEVLDSERPPYY